MKQKFTVTGMTCSACSAHVEKAVCKLEGVGEVNVNLLGGSMQVDFDPTRQNSDSIIAAVVESGYGASLPGEAIGKTAKTAGLPDMEEELSAMKRRLIISFSFLFPSFISPWGIWWVCPFRASSMARKMLSFTP